MLRTPRRAQLSFSRQRQSAASGSTSDIPRNPAACFTAQRHMTARWGRHEGRFTLELRRGARRADQWNSCTIAGNQVQRLCRVVRRGPRLTHVPSELWSLWQIERHVPMGDEGTVTTSGRVCKGAHTVTGFVDCSLRHSRAMDWLAHTRSFDRRQLAGCCRNAAAIALLRGSNRTQPCAELCRAERGVVHHCACIGRRPHCLVANCAQ